MQHNHWDSGARSWLSDLRWSLAPAALVLLLAALVGWLHFRARSEHVYALPAPSWVVERSSAALARGEHLVRGIAGCAECHGGDLGGRILAETPLFRAVAPNLTRGIGSAVHGYTERAWWNAIVHGVRRDQRSLLLMPCKELASFDDRDVAAMVAFLETLPPVNRVPGVSSVNPLGQIVVGLTGMPIFSAENIEHGALRTAAPERGPTREYGSYLLNVCRGCHGANLRGGIVIHPGAPPSADISPRVSPWEFASFERALREGKGRDGRVLDGAMPWRSMKTLSNDELRAVARFASRIAGMREHLSSADVRALLRLLSELRELGADPGAWRAHLVANLESLCSARVAVISELRVNENPERAATNCAEAVTPLQSVDHGLDALFRERFYRDLYFIDHRTDDALSGVVPLYGSAFTVSRQNVITDRQWERSDRSARTNAFDPSAATTS